MKTKEKFLTVSYKTTQIFLINLIHWHSHKGVKKETYSQTKACSGLFYSFIHSCQYLEATKK